MARIVEAQVAKAIDALIANHEKHLTKVRGKQLLTDEEEFHLVFSVKKIAEDPKSAKPIRIAIPHPFLSTNKELCLFSPDEQKHYRSLLIDTHHIPNLKKVVSISKLRTNYKRHEAKRKLLNSYDLFLVDKAVAPLVAPLLGRDFYRTKKQPIPVQLDKKNVHKQFANALNATYLYPPRGATFTVRAGCTDQTSVQVLENILAAVDPVIQQVPKGWENIQSIHLKTNRSPSLPIYTSLPDMATSVEGFAAGVRKRKRAADDTGEKKPKNESEKKKATKQKAKEEEEEEANGDEEEEEKVVAKPTPKKGAATPKKGAATTPKKGAASPATTPKKGAATTPKKGAASPATTPKKGDASPATTPRKGAAAAPSPKKGAAVPPPAKKQKVAAAPKQAATPQPARGKAANNASKGKGKGNKRKSL